MNKSKGNKAFSLLIVFLLLGTLLSCLKHETNHLQRYKLISLKDYEKELYNPNDYNNSVESLFVAKKKLPSSVATKRKTVESVAKALYYNLCKETLPIKKISSNKINKDIWKVIVLGNQTLCVYIQVTDGRILHIQKNDKIIMDKIINFRQDADSFYIPDHTVLSFSGGIVNDYILAGSIGVAYLCDVYGDDIEKEKPFHIVKYKNSWIVVGTGPNDGAYHGNGSIEISRQDAMVSFYFHDE